MEKNQLNILNKVSIIYQQLEVLPHVFKSSFKQMLLSEN